MPGHLRFIQVENEKQQGCWEVIKSVDNWKIGIRTVEEGIKHTGNGTQPLGQT